MALVSHSRIKIVAVMVTIVVMVSHYFLPPKYISIHPSAHNVYSIYSDGDWGGASSVKWLDQDATRWMCNIKRSTTHPVCGLSINWSGSTRKSLNADGYNSLRLTLKYKGPASILRIYMRNYDEEHGVIDDRDTHKFMSVNIPTADLGVFSSVEDDSHTYVTEIALAELQVADWWKDEYKVDRHSARPSFNRVTSFGIDFPFPQEMGEHTLQLDGAELVAERMPAEQLYLGIILAWLLSLFLEALWHVYRWRKVANENLRQVKHLTDYAEALKVKSEKYRELSHIDNLTEVYNRYGFMQTLKKLFGQGALNGCLIVIDIDHFKAVNDNFGHVTGDNILLEVARLISRNIRKSDVFARWGGEEFVLLVTNYELNQAASLAEKLRSLVESNTFENDKKINITVSIGLTSFTKSDSLNSAFLRADEALYEAKTQGRNKTVSAPR